MLALSSSQFDPRQTLRLTLARCALVRAIGRDRLTTVEVWPLDSGLGSHAFQQSEVFPKEKHDVTTPTSVTSC